MIRATRFPFGQNSSKTEISLLVLPRRVLTSSPPPDDHLLVVHHHICPLPEVRVLEGLSLEDVSLVNIL